jgi:hypothetical protein
MLPDLTGNVSILALSNRQPRQHFYRLRHRFSQNLYSFVQVFALSAIFN